MKRRQVTSLALVKPLLFDKYGVRRTLHQFAYMIYVGSPSFYVLKVQNEVKLYGGAHALMLPEVEEWSHDRAARPFTPKNTEK